MTKEIHVKPGKIRNKPEAKTTPKGRLTLPDVHLALSSYKKTVKAYIENVNAKLATNSSI